MKKARYLWIFPVLVIALGGAVIVSAYVQRGQVIDDVRHSFETHVESVARLVREGVREATAAVDLIYTLSEDNMETTVDLLTYLKEEALDSTRFETEGVRVWLLETATGEFDGRWGPLESKAREVLIREILKGEEGELIETEIARQNGLYCAYYVFEEGRRIACKDAADLSQLRRETGLGPLLREVVSQDVVFVAIQDENGMLASSQETGKLSEWGEDTFLARARDSKEKRLIFRKTDREGVPLFEGAEAFPLPDGTVAVLRVGVDASSLINAEEQVDSHYRILVAVVALLVLISLVATWLLGRWERRRQEAGLKLAEREEESRHWQAMGQMAATVAHEVRNPLSTVKMAAQRLGSEFNVSQADRSEHDGLIDVLQSEVDRVNLVVTEFLELGRPLELSLEMVVVESILSETMAPLRLRAEQEGKQLELENRFDGTVRVDRQRLIQIVSNLLGNALDAIDSGGKVSLRSYRKEDDLHLEINDDGEGMDKETLDRVQEPFVTTRAKGTGLGIPLASRLIEAHGGVLTMTSTPDKGTRVHVLLPTPAREFGKGE
ncbi:MAG: hypothetical protein GY847_06190 [Proteobacteria bacterium]|nr:hypothetical protein [Pseudomonadota bacterium]